MVIIFMPNHEPSVGFKALHRIEGSMKAYPHTKRPLQAMVGYGWLPLVEGGSQKSSISRSLKMAVGDSIAVAGICPDISQKSFAGPSFPGHWQRLEVRLQLGHRQELPQTVLGSSGSWL